VSGLGRLRHFFNVQDADCHRNGDNDPRSPRGERHQHGQRLRYAILHFNPRSPRGERPIPRGITTGAWPNFNPRSPRGERHSRPLPYASSNQFQSTLPTRGATPRTHSRWDSAAISIHAPHAGSDTVGRYRTPVQINFNPRSPRGERRDGDVLRVFGMPISIHAPHAGSDLVLLELVYGLRYISIHAPHAGSDLCRC